MTSGLDYSGINQFLTIYTWFPLAALMAVMLLIARFYEKQSGQNTYYRWFLLPIVIFGMAAARASSINLVFGDPIVSVSMFFGGITLAILCLTLFRLMTVGR